MSLQRSGNWRIVIELSQTRDEDGEPTEFNDDDRANAERAVKELAGQGFAQLEGGVLRIAIIVADRTASEAWDLATRAARQALFARHASPQLWQIAVHTTGPYVVTQ